MYLQKKLNCLKECRKKTRQNDIKLRQSILTSDFYVPRHQMEQVNSLGVLVFLTSVRDREVGLRFLLLLLADVNCLRASFLVGIMVTARTWTQIFSLQIPSSFHWHGPGAAGPKKICLWLTFLRESQDMASGWEGWGRGPALTVEGVRKQSVHEVSWVLPVICCVMTLNKSDLALAIA